MELTKKPSISETNVELIIRSKFPEQSRLLEDLYSAIGLASAVYVNMGENKKLPQKILRQPIKVIYDSFQSLPTNR